MQDDCKIVALDAFVGRGPGKAAAEKTRLLRSGIRRCSAAALALTVVAGAIQLGAQVSAPREGSSKPIQLSKSWNGSALLRVYSTDVRDAEAVGAAYPRVTTPDGKGVRRCIEADGDATGMPNTVRSGEFTVGAFSVYSERWRQGAGKLWWQPTHVLSHDTLTVEARRVDGRVDGAVDRRVFRESDLSYNAFAGIPSTDQPTYQLRIQLPSTGVWLLTAHTGTDWGCVLFAFQ